EVGALHPRLVRGHPDLSCEPEDRIVLGPQPRASAVDRRAVGQVMGPDPTPDAVARLEDDDRLPTLAQPTRGGEPGIPGADDADVRLHPLRHGVAPYPIASWN